MLLLDISSHCLQKDCAIEIYTNGTILPDKNILEACRALPIRFYISNYGSLSRRINELRESLESYSIEYTVEDELVWQDCGKILPYSQDNVNYKYSNCCVSKTFSLIGSRVYSCPFSANFHNIYKDAIISSRDYIELGLYSPSDISKKIKSMILNEKPLSACYYCNGRDYTVGNVPVAVQTKKTLSR